jgi:hypothetical protein
MRLRDVHYPAVVYRSSIRVCTHRRRRKADRGTASPIKIEAENGNFRDVDYTSHGFLIMVHFVESISRTEPSDGLINPIFQVTL